ncbi:MAG TPA: HTTM domain-containing protein [Pirellulaceae bacterium]|nr:HTTM domain-containing protein [Pirellulaceae bacterium]
MVAVARSPLRIESWSGPVPRWLVSAVALDLRGLSVLRMGLGAILLWDLAVRALALSAHYTDAGLLPRRVRMGLIWDYNEPWWMSLHMLSGEVWWQGVLFAAAAVAAVMLAAGYRTRWATIASWLLLLSLHGRNPLLLQGGDVLLRCLLFWSMFVPLGARWGVDAWLAKRRGHQIGAPTSDPEIASAGTAAIIIQLACMYAFTALLKTSPAWRSDFSAVHYALSIDHYTSRLGYELLRYPRLLATLTAGSWVLEGAGPLLLLSPIGRRWVRTIVPLAMIGFHLGLALAMTLGTFPWICIAAWAALLPRPVWDALDRHLAPRNAAGSRSEATRWTGSLVGNTAIACLLALVVVLNVKRLFNPLATVGGYPIGRTIQAAGLWQYWNMFSPGPYEYGGWLRIEGQTADGRLVNLYQPDQPLPDAKPPLVSTMYPTQHWRRSIVTLWEYAEPSYRESVLRFFVRQWNEAHDTGEEVVQARLVQVIVPTQPPGSTALAPPERLFLAEWPEVGNNRPPAGRINSAGSAGP